MNITITGRKIALNDEFKSHIAKKLRKFDRFFEENAEAHVTLTAERDRQTVEITVRNSGMIYRAEETSRDISASLDSATDILLRQIHKNKTKLAKRLKTGAFTEDIPDKSPDYDVVRVKKFKMKPMNVDEAILQMNMLGHSFFTFINDETSVVNVVYKRRDGGYGLLEPTVA